VNERRARKFVGVARLLNGEGQLNRFLGPAPPDLDVSEL
jgi:hypothetical protein